MVDETALFPMVAGMSNWSRRFGFLGLVAAAWLAGVPSTAAADGGTRAVRVEAAACPEHAAWAAAAETLANEWYPRLGNLLASDIAVELPRVRIRIDPAYRGVAAASGAEIRIAADWVKEHPEDARGVVIHELVHVVQAYPENREGWITEGIADYLRCAVFEGRPLREFPRPSGESPYRDGYKPAAGFLFWLESTRAPGTVRRLNAALRNGTYGTNTFREIAGAESTDLWRAYCEALERPQQSLPPDPRRFFHDSQGGGEFAILSEGLWVERQQGREVWRFREVARSGESIELLDEARPMRLRLTAGEVQWFRDGLWTPLYSGRWTAAPGRNPGSEP
ncbi:MAG: hypothetical protein J0L84_06400 [Verrucomicrobia bacterium]|nr:hypothetical protein [Verrucomicrobiota bacterium]